MTVRTSTLELLIQQGYKLIDDAWSLNGRLTYHHNDEANKQFIDALFERGTPNSVAIDDPTATSNLIDGEVC